MNQQTPTAILSAYPAFKASDVLLWQDLGGLKDELADDDQETRALMSARLEKILQTTRLSWAKVRAPD